MPMPLSFKNLIDLLQTGAFVSTITKAFKAFSFIFSALFRIVKASFIMILLFLLMTRMNSSGPRFINTVRGGSS